MQMKKRVLSAFMALCMVCSLVGAAWAVIPQQTSAAANGQFTISWSNGQQTQAVDISCYNADNEGQALSVSPENFTAQSGETVNFTSTNQNLQIDGYEFVEAKYYRWNNWRDINSLTIEYFNRRWLYTVNNDYVSDLPQIRLYYRAVEESDFYIEDTVGTNGQFTATFADGKTPQLSNGQYITYTWTRGLDSSNISTNVAYTKVTGDSYNMAAENSTQNAIWVNVALDSDVADAVNDNRYWYQVVAQVMNADGTPVADQTYTATLQVPYYIQLQNGSFENPNIETYTGEDWQNNHQWQFSNDTEGLIWKTTGLGTGSDHTGDDIEILRADTQAQRANAQQYHHCGAADDGVQYAELNCEAYGALYQEVMTVPGSTLNWAFSHLPREVQKSYYSRTGDTMALVIMPSSAADEYIERLEKASKDSDQIRSILNEIRGQGEENGYFVQEETSNYQYLEDGTNAGEHAAEAWNRYQGTYTVADNQYLTTFFFVAVDTGSTASNKETIGNLLDRVYFTTDLIPANPDSANLTVTKTVEGLNLEENSAYNVTVDVYDGQNKVASHTFDANDFDAQGKASYNFVIQGIPVNGSKTLTVTETATGASEGYNVTQTVLVGSGSEEDGTTASVTVEGGQNYTVAFTNTYTQTTTSLILTKTFDGLSDAEVNYLIFDQDTSSANDDDFGWDINYCQNTTHVSDEGGMTYMATDVPEGIRLPDGTAVTGGGDFRITAQQFLTVGKNGIDNISDITNNSYRNEDTGATLSKNQDGNWTYSVTLTVPVTDGNHFYTVFEQHQEVPGYAKINDSNAEWTMARQGMNTTEGTGKFMDESHNNIYESMTEINSNNKTYQGTTYSEMEDVCIAAGAFQKIKITSPTTIAYTNHYTGKLDVTKEIGSTNEYNDAKTANYTLTLAPANAEKQTVNGGLSGKVVHYYTVDQDSQMKTATLTADGSFTVTIQPDETIHFIDLPAIQWKVTEGDAKVNGYKLNTVITDDNKKVVSDKSHWNGYGDSDIIGATNTDDGIASVDSAVRGNTNPVVVADSVALVTVTNSYTNSTLTISKTVGGNMGDTTKDFTFTLKILNSKDGQPLNAEEYGVIAQTAVKTSLNQDETFNLSFNDAGEAKFTLHSGQELQINIPEGYYCVVSEKNDGYTTTISAPNTDGNVWTMDADKVTVSGTIVMNTEVQYTNNLNLDTPPSGFFEDNLPFTLMISAAGLAGIALIVTILVRRQRRRRE